MTVGIQFNLFIQICINKNYPFKMVNIVPNENPELKIVIGESLDKIPPMIALPKE